MVTMRDAARLAAVTAVGALAIALIACVPVVREIKIQSDVLAPQPAPIERMLVIASYEQRLAPDSLFDGMQDALTQRLATCGVRANVIFLDPTVLGAEDRLAGELRSAQPNAVLTVRMTGGHSARERWFDLALVDPQMKTPTWRAKSTVDADIGSYNRWRDAYVGYWEIVAQVGATFGTSVVSRLRDDGVLAKCPLRENAWPQIQPQPGCLQERRRGVKGAAGTLPTCNPTTGAS